MYKSRTDIVAFNLIWEIIINSLHSILNLAFLYQICRISKVFFKFQLERIQIK